MRNAVPDRLSKQLDFLRLVDGLKRIQRMTQLIHKDGEPSRRENSAEHSWHVTLMAMLLSEHTNQPIQLLHVLKMLLIHDIVEVDAGDTFVYDKKAMEGKAEREEKAAQRIFGALPEDQAREFLAIWHEFELGQTPEALFAAALDRLAGMLPNAANDGGTWREHAITTNAVRERNERIGNGSTALWDEAGTWIEALGSRGILQTDRTSP